MSRLSVTPVRVEVYDDEIGNLVATVQQNDEVTVKVEIMQVIGWNDWMDLTDAVRRAMHMMNMNDSDPDPLAKASKPHGY
jgi:hypothetical protein